ncbi:MAG: SSU ribosomal protein S15p (S13e), partial [uncultured Phycisphaerae bacterium]
VDHGRAEDADRYGPQDTRQGHRLAGSPDRPADEADHGVDRPPADAQEGPLLPPRAAEDGQQAEQPAEVPDPRRPNPVPADHREARPAKV